MISVHEAPMTLSSSFCHWHLTPDRVVAICDQKAAFGRYAAQSTCAGNNNVHGRSLGNVTPAYILRYRLAPEERTAPENDQIGDQASRFGNPARLEPAAKLGRKPRAVITLDDVNKPITLVHRGEVGWFCLT
jgi:hypothetical protein